MIQSKPIHCEPCRQAAEKGQPNIQGEIISGGAVYVNRNGIYQIIAGNDFFILCSKHRDNSPIYEFSQREKLFDFEGRRFKARELFQSAQFLEEITGGTQNE